MMLDLEELTHLDLHGNQFIEIPSWLGLSKSLCSIDCGDNPLAESTKTIYLEGFEKFVDHLRNLYEQQQLYDLIQKKPPGSIMGANQILLILVVIEDIIQGLNLDKLPQYGVDIASRNVGQSLTFLEDVSTIMGK
eukprot:Gb_34562 [translate_table: standard]